MGPTPAEQLFSIGATAAKARMEPARRVVSAAAAGPEGRREGVERFSKSLERASSVPEARARGREDRGPGVTSQGDERAQVEAPEAQEARVGAQESERREGDRSREKDGTEAVRARDGGDVREREDVGEGEEATAPTEGAGVVANETGETVEAVRASVEPVIDVEGEIPLEGVKAPVEGVKIEQAPQTREEAQGEAQRHAALAAGSASSRSVEKQPEGETRTAARVSVARETRASAPASIAVNETSESEGAHALAGSHVDADVEVSAEASREILRLAAEAGARAGESEENPQETAANRERGSASAAVERAEGRAALDRLIDAGRPVVERPSEQAPQRAPDGVKSAEPATHAASVASPEGASANSGEPKQQGQDAKRDARSTTARAIDATHVSSKRPDDKPELHAAPKPGADPSLGLSATHEPTIKPAHAGAKGTAQVQAAYDGANVEAAASRGLMAAVQQKGGAVTVRLDPESLGSMRIRMELSGGVVRATIEVTNPEARDLLGSKLDSLRSSLEAKGLGVERLQVQLTSAGQGGSANNDSSSGEGRWHGSRSSPDAGDGRTRGDAGGGRDGREGEPRDRRESGFAGALGGAWREEWMRVGVDALV